LAWALGLISVFVSALSLISVLAKADPAKGTLTISEYLNNISEDELNANPEYQGHAIKTMDLLDVGIFAKDPHILQVTISPYSAYGETPVTTAFIRFDDEADALYMEQLLKTNVSDLRLLYFQAPPTRLAPAEHLRFVDRNNQVTTANPEGVSVLASAVTARFNGSSYEHNLDTLASGPRQARTQAKIHEWERKAKAKLYRFAECVFNVYDRTCDSNDQWDVGSYAGK
jgi:hypothetical protein